MRGSRHSGRHRPPRSFGQRCGSPEDRRGPDEPDRAFVKDGGDYLRPRRDLRHNRRGSATAVGLLEHVAEEAVQAAARDAHLLHVTGVTLAVTDPDGLLRFLGRLRTSVDLSVDVNWRPALWEGRESQAPDLLRALARAARYVFLGRHEAQVVLGTDDPHEVRACLPEAEHVVVKDDANAVFAFRGATLAVTTPDHVKNVVDAVGAGDAFAAGYLSAALDGRDPHAASTAGHVMARSALLTDCDHVTANPGTSLMP